MEHKTPQSALKIFAVLITEQIHWMQIIAMLFVYIQSVS